MKRALILCAAIALAACGDNNDNAKNTNGGNNDTGTSADAGNNNNGDDAGDDNVVANNGMDAGANNNNGEDTGGNNNTTGDMGMNNTTGDMGMNNTTGDMGSTNNDMGDGTHLEAHGCTFETAMDMTGAATVSITDVAAWTFDHNACIIVDTGTEVTWTGNFNNHPLEGGVSPNDDATNPIDVAGVIVNAMNGNNTAEVMFPMAGDYPYFCGLHVNSMQGVVYVVD